MAQLTALPLRRVLRNMFGNGLVFACVKWYEGGGNRGNKGLRGGTSAKKGSNSELHVT